MWFALAAFISGIYFALDEFLRRGIQRATDWQTGFALGLAGALVAALAVAASLAMAAGAVGDLLGDDLDLALLEGRDIDAALGGEVVATLDPLVPEPRGGPP